jgi:anthranilate synthase component 1
MEPAFSPTREAFSRVFSKQKTQIVYQRIINDLDTPVSAYLKLALGKPYAFLFESVQGGEQRGRYSFLGFSPDIVWRSQNGQADMARGLDKIAAKDFTPIDAKPLDSLRALQAECSFDLPDGIPPMAAGLFGYLGYDMVREVEHLPSDNPDVIGTPDAIMIRPTIIAIFDQIAQEIIFATPVDGQSDSGGGNAAIAYDAACARIRHVVKDLSLPAGNSNIPALAPLAITPKLGADEASFKSRVQKAKDYVKAGDVFQVVIGQRLEADMPASEFALYRSLRRMNPSPFLYFLQFDDHAIVGSSPEILVRLRDGIVTIRPIAGTRPRGKTAEEDLAMEAELLADQKECAEHLMLLDLGRNDVGRVSKAGTVKVTEKFIIERYSHVMHIVSNVEGELRGDLDAISALFAGFPAGTVSGAPKVRAMEIIDELESERRGIYGGAVGYISADGNMDTAIVLRTAIIKDGKLHVRAGAGIVMDSNPKMEFEETLHKSAALFRAAEHSPKFDRN